MIRILFFVNGGTGGSEACIYNIIRHMDAKIFQAELVLCENNNIPQDLIKKVKTHVLPSKKSRFNEVVDKVSRNFTKIELDERFISKVERKFVSQLWYINTGVLPHIAQFARSIGKPYVVHFHELTSVFDQMKGDTLEKMVQGATLNIACAKAVLNNLDLLQGKNNQLFYEHIDISTIKINDSRVSEIRKELNLKEYNFCWVMAGATSPRKGFDLFIEIASKKLDSCFLWVGKQRDHGYNRIITRRIHSEGLSNVKLIEQQGKDYFNYLEASDGFILTSREDPFPLVMIEAAYLKKPIVSFDSGGVSEFVLPELGVIIDPFNIPEFVKAISDIELGKIKIDHDKLKSRAEQFNIKSHIKDWQVLLIESFPF